MKTTTTPAASCAATRTPHYVAPAIEVIEIESEGVIGSSGNLPGYGDGDMFSTGSNNRMRSNYNAASFSDLEDAINDILTFEK